MSDGRPAGVAGSHLDSTADAGVDPSARETAAPSRWNVRRRIGTSPADVT